MGQLELKLLGRLDAPAVVPQGVVAQVKSYREAVCLSWIHRRTKGMTKSTLAEFAGMRPSHLSDYLSLAEKDRRGHDLREMPAKYLPAFEAITGNTFATQWLAMQSKLTILESMIAEAA